MERGDGRVENIPIIEPREVLKLRSGLNGLLVLPVNSSWKAALEVSRWCCLDT